MRDNHEKSVQPAAKLIVGLLDEANDALNRMVAAKGGTKAKVINDALIRYADAYDEGNVGSETHGNS